MQVSLKNTTLPTDSRSKTEKENMKQESNYKKFMIIWAGDLISQIGGGLTSFGLGVWVFNRTGSAAQMALVTLLGFLPTLLLSVPAGVLADLYDRRTLMMIGDGCSALGILYILIMMMTSEPELWQICLGVFISAVFSSLLEPAYRATVTDLLTDDEYTRANGLTSLSGSARYLISPVIAGILIGLYGIKLLLVIDICTFFVTLSTTALVKRSIGTSGRICSEGFFETLIEGWRAVCGRKGVLLLIIISSVISMYIGVIQVLSEPLLLSFTDSKTLGIAETVCALGMLVTALIVGIAGIRGHHPAVLAISLALAGVFMIGFSLKENVILICIFGFLFFAMLPPANSSLDYLARTNIPDGLQGRVWGFIGFISQLGYIPAYAMSGILADRVGSMRGIGVGRGSAMIIGVSGVMLIAVSLLLLFSGRIRNLEYRSELITERNTQ